MYFETLHKADTFDPLDVPEIYSCYETDVDEDPGFGSLIYDRVNGDSASAVNLIEVEDILHRRDDRVTLVLPSINEGPDTDEVRQHSVDSRSTGSNGTLKDSCELRKSSSSQNSQDSGRDSNDSSQRAHRKLSAEGRRKATKDKAPKEANPKTAAARSRSREKPSSRMQDHQPVASKAKYSSSSGPPQRVVVGAEDSHYAELSSTFKSMRIAGHSSSTQRVAAAQVLSQPRYYYPPPGTHRSATPMTHHNPYNSQLALPVRTAHRYETNPSACQVPVYVARPHRRPSGQHRYLGFV